MNHKYFQQFLWIMAIFLSSCNSQKLIQNVSEIPKNIDQKKINISTSNTTVSQNMNELEKSVFAGINKYRKSRNLPMLQWDGNIAQESRIHAQQMATRKTTFSHDGFKKRVEIISQKIPYKAAAENIAVNMGFSNPGEKAVVGWINSPGHHKNIVGDFNLTGIGIAKNNEGKYYFNQIFIKTR
ncbi:MAG: CAP domain-containing protein [Trichodesmium sp. St15_bin1_1]|nr:CAP domain-containing protein [Trichodesmium sp. St15_bin1_1]